MARIRSVHPGLFTDEAWVSCSPMARVLVIGLWTDADDQGVFEWKPLQLKMRLLPADAADVAELLEEIKRAGVVMGYEVDGKRYGAIRNFRKYQRPQKPNALHPLPDFAALYVGLSATNPEPVRDQYATGTGEAHPMEDGGGKVGGEEGSPGAKAPSEPPVAPNGATAGENGSKKTPAWAKDKAFCQAWDACTPEMRRRSKGREQSYDVWREAAKITGGEDALLMAVRRYVREDSDVKRKGGRGFDSWLADGRWEAWLVDGEGSGGLPLTTWSGPAELRRAVCLEATEAFVRSYLDTSEWTPEGLRPRTRYAFDKLKPLRAMRGLTVLEPQGAAA